MKKDKKYDFQKFKRSFRREIYNNSLYVDDALEQQIRLKDDIDIFKKSSKPKRTSQKRIKTLTLKNSQLYLLMEGKKFLIFLKAECFQKQNRHKEKDVQVF